MTADLAVQRAAKDNPGWGWEECVVCGKPAEVRAVAFLEVDGTLARVGWCRAGACDADRRSTTAYYPSAAVTR